MSDNLEKAQQALADAKKICDGPPMNPPPTDGKDYHVRKLLDIAAVQATVAQATALERIADVLESVLAVPDGPANPYR